MTVCVCVKVNECMVFAADSASSFDGLGKTDSNGDPIQQVYRFGNKVFQLHKQRPIMAMTCGLGNFGRSSIAFLAKELRRQLHPGGERELADGYTMAQVAECAHDFLIKDRFAQAYHGNSADGVRFEFWIGGYGDGENLPELWKLTISDGQAADPVCHMGKEDVGVTCGGQPDPILRLINGFGWRLESILKDNGVTPQSHPQLYQSIAPQLYLSLAHPNMPIQDAIDLTDFLADMTKKVFRFRAVPEYVSGDIDIATITKHERFRWIKRKHYYPAGLNRETDHE